MFKKKRVDRPKDAIVRVAIEAFCGNKFRCYCNGIRTTPNEFKGGKLEGFIYLPQNQLAI